MKKLVYFASLLMFMMTSCNVEDVTPSPDPDPDPQPDTTVVATCYQAMQMVIETEDRKPIVSKEKEDYMPCTVSIDGAGVFEDYEGIAQIRGRGNSSWLWYDKKPYRIKLDQKSPILGLGQNSDWVLLANFRDPTDLMNTFGFEMSAWLGLPYSIHYRYVEVTLNGDYIGLYQLTEQVEHGANRVAVDKDRGILICLDADDGPDLSPEATDNFWSEVYWLPVCVKYPSDPSADSLEIVKEEFAELEEAVSTGNYDRVAALMDIPSFINYLILQELIYNVEIDAPRSTFMFKDVDGLWTWGPAWDFDAGFDFDWGTMYDGHNYFMAQELVLGTDPANHRGGYHINDFFTNMFTNAQFVSEYQARWNEISDQIMPYWTDIQDKYVEGLEDAMDSEYARWPIDRYYEDQIPIMEDWLTERVSYLDRVIAAYPGGGGQTPTEKEDCGSLSYDVTMSAALGYHQEVSPAIEGDKLAKMFGISENTFDSQAMEGKITIVPLKTDGTEGENNTNGIYGGWFEGDNNPGVWANGHVFIEVGSVEWINYWSVGVHPDNCHSGDAHTVRMQYQYPTTDVVKTVTVSINFTIAD